MRRASSSTSWSGKTSARCSSIRSTSGLRYGGRTEASGCLKSSRARLKTMAKALAHTERQKRRLLEAYLGGVLELPS